MRPLPDDVRFFEASVAQFAGEAQGLRALLLGVTPAIATMRWPASTHLVALDGSDDMLRNVFPREQVASFAHPLRGDWREIPVAKGAFDIVVGDGCYSAFADREGPTQLNREVARVLRKGGRFCLRCHRTTDRLFATLPELEELARATFDLLDCEIPAYEGGEHFPRLTMERRADA